MAQIPLAPIDRVEILSLMDNSLDTLMSSTSIAKRAPLGKDKFRRPQLRAEHGESMLVTVVAGDRTDAFLFDVGVTPDGVLHNMDVLEVRANELRSIVISHGHTDHTGGMSGLYARYGRRQLPIILHPDAWLNRRQVWPDGREVDIPPPKKRDLEQEGFEVVEERGPSYILEGKVLITGQIQRATEFEQGVPFQRAEKDGAWVPDPWIHDDQAIVFHVAGKGLVVVTGCGHAGIINTIRHAQQVTGVDEVYAVVGGMHLTGQYFEPRIPATLAELRKINPKVLVPEHCTGWRMTVALATQFPEAYVPNSVGTTLVL